MNRGRGFSLSPVIIPPWIQRMGNGIVGIHLQACRPIYPLPHAKENKWSHIHSHWEMGFRFIVPQKTLRSRYECMFFLWSLSSWWVAIRAVYIQKQMSKEWHPLLRNLRNDYDYDYYYKTQALGLIHSVFEVSASDRMETQCTVKKVSTKQCRECG